MIKKHLLQFLLASFMAALVAGGTYVSRASALTPNTIVVDCNINVGTEWQADEYMGIGGTGSGDSLYMTWDATYLYIGITSPTTVKSVYIDTASGGMSTTNPANGFGTAPIANSGRGYEYFYMANTVGFLFYSLGSSGAWVDGSTPAGTQVCSNASAVEWGIPWADIGVPPGGRVTVLVLTSATPGTVSEYWPNAAGNTVTPSLSFSQGVVFNQPGQAGVSPGGSPTAVTLQSLSANSNTAILPIFLIAALLLALMGSVALRRRCPHFQQF